MLIIFSNLQPLLIAVRHLYRVPSDVTQSSVFPVLSEFFSERERERERDKQVVDTALIRARVVCVVDLF